MPTWDAHYPSATWPSVPQLSVLLLVTHRINAQIITLTHKRYTACPQYTTSYQLPPFIV